MKLTQKQLLDFIWNRKKFPKESLKVYVDDIHHQPFLSVIAFWKWYSRTPQIIFIDRLNNQSVLKNEWKLLLLLIIDICRWPLIYYFHHKRLSNIENTRYHKIQTNNKNNVLYLRSDQWFNLTSGGSVGHTSGVINAFIKLNKKLTIWSSDHLKGVEHPIEILSSNFNKGGNIPELMDIQFNRSIIDFASKQHYKPDFIYQRYSLLNYSGVALRNSWNIPLVLEYNGSFVWIGKNWGGAKMIHRRMVERVEKLCLDKSDLIVVVSQVSKDDLIREYNIDENKIIVNPNGVDEEIYHPEISGGSIRSLLGLQDKRVFGFIGTFSHWHGVLFLAEAIQLFYQKYPELKSKISFLLIGMGPQFNEVKEKLNDLLEEGCVVLPGQISQELGPEYLAACDVYLSPHVPNPDGTKFFGSPTKLFEYMAMGKPILASSLEQIGEILEDGKTARLFQPGNLSELVELLFEMSFESEKWFFMGKTARQICLEKYTWQKHVERIISGLK